MSEISAGDASINRLNVAVSAFESIMIAPEGTMVDVPNSPPQPSLAERVKQSLDALTQSPAQSAAEAKTSAQQSQQSAQQSAASSAQAKIDADRAAAANPDNWESAPYPDVWIPFNDSLKMEAGFAPYDTITVSGASIPLPTRSATFTRASTATYIDKSGVMQTAGINEPRFEKEGLLIEGASTNLVPTSVTMTASVGFNNMGDGTKPTKVSGFVSPDGTTNAFRSQFARVTQSGRSMIEGQGLIPSPVATETTYTASIWLKSNTSTLIDMTMRLGATTLKITVTPEWKLFPITRSFKAGETDTTLYFVGLYSMETNMSADLLVFAPQLEALPFATSYIPTNGAAATRAADFWKIPNSGNIPADSKVSFALDFDSVVLGSTSNDYRNLFVVDGGRYVYFNPGNSGVSALANGSLPAFSLTPDGSVKAGVINTLAMSCDGTNTKSVINAGSVISKPNRLLNAPNFSASGTVYMDTGSSGIRALYGHIRNFRIWHRALTDAQLKSLR